MIVNLIENSNVTTISEILNEVYVVIGIGCILGSHNLDDTELAKEFNNMAHSKTCADMFARIECNTLDVVNKSEYMSKTLFDYKHPTAIIYAHRFFNYNNKHITDSAIIDRIQTAIADYNKSNAMADLLSGN